ncbi:A/G-specific adenine glycosylase [Heyndrickxia sporothermodurans]|uniref:A/G-specific adenine glycosylase n=1 Tax=Heyndrickxia sporothermodurans TaxID=46224 RepID=UPI002E23E156|nr:A/G-specific adenine glycosylase [Heyndrickxia sporothermodurans]MED3653014.1 A/G-specific adenine glycosylase [Heyndrickxia sporothermodurans]MED3697474.1 A/G-specific adenine glycosylase [Heyndrickxia sporothermodurans]MED3782304.1 A/G-specific adenine glycosylase [Heyndrickxia sporothermodurans]
MSSNIEHLNIMQFQNDLLHWFTNEQRDLPWRKDQDPYKVWVSEIMLQQTRVDTVIPYFNRFIENFPTIKKLAEADEESVLKAWEGLGYYSRVRNLQAAVREVHESYGGVVPNTPEEIKKLKGVGPYTAGAILSIAYGVPEPAVDGNVMRVLSRILLIWDDIAKASSRKVFEEAVREIISHDNPSYFNQALMELGALICTPTSPSCLLCPVREHCQAFHEGVQEQLPVKTKKKSTRHVELVAAVLKDRDGRFLIHKRPEQGLLANLWEFPTVEKSKLIKPKDILRDFLKHEYDLHIQLDKTSFTSIPHVFSHLTWDIEAYSGTIENEVKEEGNMKLVTTEELTNYAFPVSYQKMWKAYLESVKDN